MSNAPQSLTSRLTRGLVAVLVALPLSILPLVAAPAPADAAKPVMTAAFLPAGDPVQVQFTLEGCRLPATQTLINPPFICDDAYYTTGNLGKSWNELDNVPHRLTASSSTAQTYTFAISADYSLNGVLGYDKISIPTINTALSTGLCEIVDVSDEMFDGTSGGVDENIYRFVTLTQSADSTCVLDYYQRLALGAADYSGSSLQSNLFNKSLNSSGIGLKRVSIPVKDIEPQSISKDMNATRGQGFAWDISKTSTPASISFSDTCDVTQPTTANVSVTVSWTKTSVTSDLTTITTTVTATNPAHRPVEVRVTDRVYAGTSTAGALLDTQTGAWVLVEPGSGIVLTHSFQTLNNATTFFDEATAEYRDPLDTTQTLPGTNTATDTATVQLINTGENDTALISDDESITGPFDFKVTSITPNIGTIDAGDALDVYGTSFGWSYTASTSGSVTFAKTVRTTFAAAGTGTLSDVATVDSTSSDDTASASTSLSAQRFADLTINKSIPDVLQGAESATFYFDVYPGTGLDLANLPDPVAEDVAITFTAGETSDSAAVNNLPPGQYTVIEQPAAGWDNKAPATVDLRTGCSGQVAFSNTFEPASARVQKVTNPTGGEAGWTFTLTGPGIAAPGEAVVTTSASWADFAAVLAEGTYTVTETARTGWDPTGIAGYLGDTLDNTGFTNTIATRTCSFVVNYPADAGQVFGCQFTNTARGTIVVDKVTIPTGAEQLFDFTVSGGPDTLEHAFRLADATTPYNSGPQRPGNYTAAEGTLPDGWWLKSGSCTDGTTTWTHVAGSVAFALGAGKTVTCTFTNEEFGDVTVIKTQNGATPTFGYHFRLTGGPDSVDRTLTTDATNAGVLDFGELKAGSYTLCELAVPAGTHSSLADLAGATTDPTTGDVCYSFTLAAGESLTFNVNNQLPGGDTRTIGYWKNWNLCSNTGADRAAIAARTGNHLLEEFLPQMLGEYVVDDCQKAVAVLSNQSGKFAENTLAAQLLAAKLNVAAGAGSACITETIALADQLLIGIGYNGGSTKKNGMVNEKHAQRAIFLSTAAALDNYNNNGC